MARNKYEDWITPDGLTKIEGWARDGLINEQIAHNMGISRETLNQWCKRFPAISDALKRNKEVVDIEVENALLKRALGYQYDEVTKERLVDSGQKKRHGGESELTEKEWEFAVKYFDHRCCYCGVSVPNLTKDHIVPLKQGGKLNRENVVPCCGSCNSSKKDNDLIDWYQKQEFFDELKLVKIHDYIRLVKELGESLNETLGELVVTKIVTKEVVPDTTAQIFWLKNRRPDKWRDKRDMEVSGSIHNPYEKLTTEELKKLIDSG